MRIDKSGAIVLSRRNILALLHKLDMKDSERTIAKAVEDTTELENHLARWGTIVVKCEDDDEHCSGKEFGRMHPETEAFIKNHRGKV